MRENTPHRLSYRPEIDGLRAIAVLAVIFFHAGFSWMQGGYIGVDVFFVISGYLITFIILKERADGKFSLAEFYERRARRILPVLFFVIVACIPFAYFWMTPAQVMDLAKSAASVSAFSSNIYFWITSGYFDSVAEEKPLLHTWSLGVEEQFYLFFPLFIFCLGKIRLRVLSLIFVLLALLSLGLSIWSGHKAMVMANFFLTPMRAWELLVGGVIAAFHLLKPDMRINTLLAAGLSWLGIAGIVISSIFYDKMTPFPGTAALPPVLGAAFIIAFSKGTSVANILSMRIPVMIGLMSYSAYLWHQPIFAFVRIYSADPVSPQIFSALCALTFVASFVSWKFVEQPFRNRNFLSRPQIVSLSLAVTVFILAISTIAIISNGFEKHFHDRLESSSKIIHEKLEKSIASGGYNAMYADDKCKFWSKNLDENFKKKFGTCARIHKKSIMVIGDSHAMDLYNVAAKLSPKPFIASVSQGACRAHSHQAECSYEELKKFLTLHEKNIEAVLYTQSGLYLQDNKNLPDTSKIIDVASYLSSLPKDIRVFWVGPQPEFKTNIRDINLLLDDFKPPHENETIQAVDRALKQYSKGKSFTYISKLDPLSFSPRRDFYLEGEFTYSDADHWSSYGEDVFGKRLLADPTLLHILQKQ